MAADIVNEITSYVFRVGDTAFGPYTAGEAVGMMTVLMHIAEPGVSVVRLTSCRHADGRITQVRTAY